MTVFLDNRALLDAFRRGDRAALTEVYRRYVDEVAGVVRHGFALGGKAVRGVREVDCQRDLVQEVFVRCFSEAARKGYDGISPFRPYLLRIAKNLMIDEARKSGRAVVLEPGEAEAPAGVEVGVPSPEEDSSGACCARRPAPIAPR